MIQIYVRNIMVCTCKDPYFEKADYLDDYTVCEECEKEDRQWQEKHSMLHTVKTILGILALVMVPTIICLALLKGFLANN